MSYELKVKAATLAEEARIIRRLEKKRKRSARMAKNGLNRQRANKDREGMHMHRTFDVRRMARATHLARAFIKGHPLALVEKDSRMENHLHRQPWVLSQVLGMVTRYGRGPESRLHNADAQVVSRAVFDWARDNYVSRFE